LNVGIYAYRETNKFQEIGFYMALLIINPPQQVETQHFPSLKIITDLSRYW